MEKPLHGARHVERVVVGVARHAYHEVYVGGLEHLVGLLGGCHLRERGRIAQPQVHVLVEYLLVNAAVVLEHERVVGVGHNQHVEYSARHQVDERHVLKVELVPLCRYLSSHSRIVFGLPAPAAGRLAAASARSCVPPAPQNGLAQCKCMNKIRHTQACRAILRPGRDESKAAERV